MTNTQIKDYLKKYRIDSEEQLAKHIEELKRGTKPNNEIIFPLVDLLLNEKSVLNSFFAENKKQEMFTRTVTPFFLDEMLEAPLGSFGRRGRVINYSTRHKAREEGNFHKEIVGDLEGINRPPSTDDKNLAKKDNYTIYVFTKDLLPKILEFEDLRAIKSILKRYSASSYRVYDKDKNLIEQDVLNKDDVITSSNRGEKETMEYLQGVKETEGKVDYSEINLEILDLMAERFTANKHKYPKGNMKKTIDIKSLEWALFRHVKKMIQPIETDEETYKDHLSAVLCNCSMLCDQLNLQKN